MKPDDVNIDEVARLVLGELEGQRARSPHEPERALRTIRNELRKLVSTLDGDDSLAAPADLVRQTAELLHRRGLATLIAAVLIYDSRRQAAAGFRTSTAGCRMTFDADGDTIDLQVQPIGERWRVRGQLGETRAAAKGSVHFVVSGGLEVVANAPIDADGYFEIEVRPDEYDIQMSTSNRTILLERVRIG